MDQDRNCRARSQANKWSAMDGCWSGHSLSRPDFSLVASCSTRRLSVQSFQVWCPGVSCHVYVFFLIESVAEFFKHISFLRNFRLQSSTSFWRQVHCLYGDKTFHLVDDEASSHQGKVLVMPFLAKNSLQVPFEQLYHKHSLKCLAWKIYASCLDFINYISHCRYEAEEYILDHYGTY